MATEKKFAVAGVSTHEGKTKVRFANDTMRIKILQKNDHTDIQLIDLPREMTKGEIGAHMVATGFGQGNAAIEAAVAYVVKKNPLATAAKVSTATVAKTESVAE
jgi:hypothetical protein